MSAFISCANVVSVWVHHQPEVAADKAKTQYKDVIVGGDVWVVLDEIMTYMRDPLKYHSKKVKLPRVMNLCLHLLP